MLTRKEVQANFAEALRLMDEFEFGNAPAQKAARKVADKLRDLGIPYVVIGGLAVAAHGHKRVTVDVDLLMTREGLAKFRGYMGMPETEHEVKMDVRTPDEKPGDGKSCPFNFPSPESLGMEMGGIWKGFRILPLRELIELKLASGLTSVTRLKDHVDVMELIKVNRLANEFGDRLHPFVREKYKELWAATQVKDPYEE